MMRIRRYISLKMIFSLKINEILPLEKGVWILKQPGPLLKN